MKIIDFFVICHQVFHDLAYQAKSRDDLLAAINSFLDDSIVLAPGDWDRHLLLPLLQAEITEKRRQRIKLLKEKGKFTICKADNKSRIKLPD